MASERRVVGDVRASKREIRRVEFELVELVQERFEAWHGTLVIVHDTKFMKPSKPKRDNRIVTSNCNDDAPVGMTKSTTGCCPTGITARTKTMWRRSRACRCPHRL